VSWSFHPYALPLARPYRWAKGAQTQRRGLLARFEAGGAIGWGEHAPPPHEPVAADAVASLQHLTRGLDASRPDFLRLLDRKGPEPRLRAAIATAWLAQRATQAGIPLAELLAERSGAPRPAPDVPVNALVTAAAPEEAAADAAAAAQAGFTAFKIKCTADRAADLARVAAVRTAVGERAELRLDANGAWDHAWAGAHLSRLAEQGIRYVEDPVEDPAEAAAACSEAGVALALDAAIDGPGALLDHSDRCNFAILKPQRLGGPDHAVLVAQYARRLGIEPVITNSLESAVGVASALHAAACVPHIGACGLATTQLLARDVGVAPQIRNGAMRVPKVGLLDGPVEVA
jgi:L-Ala-D/L-Glu epimerase